MSPMFFPRDRSVQGYSDILGTVSTAAAGAGVYTVEEVRSTGITCPHMVNLDELIVVAQPAHSRMLGTTVKSFHIHWTPLVAATGTVLIDYSWAFWTPGDTIPATLGNTGTYQLDVAAADQYKYKVTSIITDLAAPAAEGYGSLMVARIKRNGGTYGPTNKIAVLAADFHGLFDRMGSVTEYAD